MVTQRLLAAIPFFVLALAACGERRTDDHSEEAARDRLGSQRGRTQNVDLLWATLSGDRNMSDEDVAPDTGPEPRWISRAKTPSGTERTTYGKDISAGSYRVLIALSADAERAIDRVILEAHESDFPVLKLRLAQRDTTVVLLRMASTNRKQLADALYPGDRFWREWFLERPYEPHILWIRTKSPAPPDRATLIQMSDELYSLLRIDEAK